MLSLLKKKANINIYSPSVGLLKDLSDSEDEVFSSRTLGEGFFVRTNNYMVHAPISGIVTSIFPTHHAIGIKNESGIELLLHIGVNIVEIEDEIIQCKLNKGDRIQAQEKIAEMIPTKFADLNISPDIYVFIVNSNGHLASTAVNKINTLVNTKDVILVCQKE